MLLVLAFDPPQIDSAWYFAAAALLIFAAAFLASRKVQKQLPAKWLPVIAMVALGMLGLIWLLVFVLNRKESAPPTPIDYPASSATP